MADSILADEGLPGPVEEILEDNLVPRLGAEWALAADGRSLSMTLRPGIRFSDGSAVDAAAVKRSFERSVRRAGGMATAFRAISGMEELLAGDRSEISGITAEGSHRLRFALTDPLPIFPALLTDLRTAVVRAPADAGEDGEKEDGIDLLGTGPFRIAERDRRRVVLERNPYTWRSSPPLLERIELRIAASASAVASDLRAGELDVGRELLPPDLEAVLRDPAFRGGLVEAPKKNVYFVLFNRSGPAARHHPVRQALAGVIRIQDIVWRTLGRFAQPATCLIPPGILGHDPGRKRPISTRQEAAELLREVGLAAPIELKAAIHPLFRDRYQSLLSALVDEWTALGFKVEVEASTMESYLERWRDARGIDLLIARWVPDYDDPDNVTYATLHSRQGAFRAYLALPELDHLLEQARHAGRAHSRQMLSRRVESLLVEEQALLPLFHDIDYRIASPRVLGLRHLATPPYVNYSEIALRRQPPAADRTPARSPTSGSLRIPVTMSFDSLEPSLALYVEPAEVVPNVFETLTCVDQGHASRPVWPPGFRATTAAGGSVSSCARTSAPMTSAASPRATFGSPSSACCSPRTRAPSRFCRSAAPAPSPAAKPRSSPVSRSRRRATSPSSSSVLWASSRRCSPIR